MAEMANVVGGEIITDEWGNQIRSRTVQRYATVAARTASHPSPVEGDLSYLQDSNTVEVFDGALWVPVGIPEVDGMTEVNGPVGLTNTLTDIGIVSLTIPTTWASWKCYATATFVVQAPGGARTLSCAIDVDGTDQQIQESIIPNAAWMPVAVQGRRTSMTTTGARSVALTAKANTGTLDVYDLSVYARAVRLT